jgi:hypothetical protein
MTIPRWDSRRALTFVGLLVLAIAGPMCGSGGGGGGGGSGGGGATFQVLSHNPVQGAGGVARTATLFVKVNGNVNPVSLTASTITLTGLGAIQVDLAWNSVTSSIEITPKATSPMDKNALHTVNLTAGVMTVGGATLTPTSFTFTTVNSDDTTRPTFGGITSVTGAGTTQVTVNWTQGTDDTSPQAALKYEVYLAVASNNQDFGTTIPVPNVTGAGSLLVSGLTPNTTYFIIVRCRDQAGNLDANTAQQFKKTLVSFSTNIYTPIVNNICVTCHTPGGISQFMDLSISASDVVTNKWVGIPADTGAGPPQMCQSSGLIRVVAGSPSTSLVYLKISQSSPPCGVQMPEGLTPLTSAQQQLFFDWITEGANNN